MAAFGGKLMTANERLSLLELQVENIQKAVEKLAASTATDKPEIVDKVELQLKRCELVKKIWAADNKGENEISRVYSAQLDNFPKVFDNKDIQAILDDFNWEAACEAAEKLGYTYGMKEEPYMPRQLIEDAIEMFECLENDNKKCGSIHQCGRLIVNKFWDGNHDEFWYTMAFFIELGETY